VSNYAVWHVGELVTRWFAWRERLGRATSHQQRMSYVGELRVIEEEMERRFFELEALTPTQPRPKPPDAFQGLRP